MAWPIATRVPVLRQSGGPDAALAGSPPATLLAGHRNGQGPAMATRNDWLRDFAALTGTANTLCADQTLEAADLRLAYQDLAALQRRIGRELALRDAPTGATMTVIATWVHHATALLEAASDAATDPNVIRQDLELMVGDCERMTDTLRSGIRLRQGGDRGQ